ncbi:mannose-1-phosphate guanylyltransferase [Fodinibius sediminis]|uniref:mannose-1-phosphate guanylyltransferase n=1 Tax=Fodinibius sediminis TaxID=1214077 RepID=A0A521ASC2_9BACT|nr:mannose-1-phosphate guanylyltransferase [Fodinibius sediminis]SMO37724.1 mannose-1-phosphate guanylyltransferase [Fodinibius sediminis]
MLHAVIMAGGSGTRFWPRSTRKHPKQFLNLFGDKTMLQTTVDRIEKLVPADRIWVITNDRYVALVQEQLPDVPAQNIVGEAVARNTAPCVALAAALINEQDPEATMAVLPADHLISEPENFLSVLDTADAKARAGDNLITIGIQPDRPETGYGYIEFETASAEHYEGGEVRKVRQFREKPDRQTAQQFIDSGNFLWNSGMFVWKASTILQEFKRHLPEVQEQVEKLRPSIGSTEQKQAIDVFYHGCPSISIDYGIMERSEDVFVVPGSFGWNDVGSWKAVYELRDKDQNGNVIQTDTASLANASNNLIQSESGKMIALVGVDNLAVVETDDAILVCNLDEAQGVKQIVNKLRESEETQKFL